MSFELILPFLRPIEQLIADAGVSEIMVNGSSGVFIERGGALEAISGVTISEKSLRIAVRNIARLLGDDISDEKPILDSRLPDGSRVAAILSPCSVDGTILTIRKFQTKRFNADELVRVGSLKAEVLEYLKQAVEKGLNILISGGTGSGKTTLLNALSAYIDPDQRVILIEDTAELQINGKHVIRLEARREQETLPPISMRELLRATLRHRPDRIIVGEVRGGEAFDLLQALNTGHSGVLSTIHANSAREALTRFTTCVLLSGVELPYSAIRAQIFQSLNLVLHIERHHGKRQAAELIRLVGYARDTDVFKFETIFTEKIENHQPTSHLPRRGRKRVTVTSVQDNAGTHSPTPNKPSYEHRGIAIYSGDCRLVLPPMQSESIDIVVTDPPYLVSYKGRWGADIDEIKGDSDPSWILPAFAEMWRLLKPDSFCISFYGWPHADIFLKSWKRIGFRPVSHIVCIKNSIGLGYFSRAQHEPAYLLAKGHPPKPKRPTTDVFLSERETNVFHPNQKPLQTMLRLIATYAPEGALVLDPFMGSGTTLVAARALGCRGIGIDIEPSFCDVAASRLAQELLDLQLPPVSIEKSATLPLAYETEE